MISMKKYVNSMTGTILGMKIYSIRGLSLIIFVMIAFQKLIGSPPEIIALSARLFRKQMRKRQIICEN